MVDIIDMRRNFLQHFCYNSQPQSCISIFSTLQLVWRQYTSKINPTTASQIMVFDV